jgi:hypothetical protein
MTVAPALAVLLLIATVVLGLRSGRAPVAPSHDPTARQALRRVYSRRTFLRHGAAVAGAAVLVYSGVDESVDDWQREHGSNDLTEPVSHQFKQFGEPYWAFVWVGMALIDRLVGPSMLGRFGRQCMQATAFGLPILWTTQRVLGSSRPTDENGPRFHPFRDENAASGHTFIGGVPFLVLLRTARPAWARAIGGVLSPVCGWTRLHDRKHYLSQVLLGYAIAWEAVDGVVTPVEEGRELERTTGS